MKIAIISDTHYGMNSSTGKILSNFFKDLSAQDFDVIVHCGDWISDKQKQMDPVLALLRKYVPTKPILGVMGNHDYWDTKAAKRIGAPYAKKYTIDGMIESHKALFAKHNITYLNGAEPVVIDGVSFFGFDGWYSTPNPPSNDSSRMPFGGISQEVHSRFIKRSYESFDNLLAAAPGYNDTFKILVTHFPSFTDNMVWKDMCGNFSYMPFIGQNFDLYIVGHSHQFVCTDRIVNCGSDYNKPRYLIREVYGKKSCSKENT